MRARVGRLRSWLERREPDLVCLQEIKVDEGRFPFGEIERAGYHATVVGQKAYNGVAILSRREPDGVVRGLGDDPHDVEARLVSVKLDDIRVLSAYVPLGTVVDTDRWIYKLEWFKRLKGHLERNLRASDPVLLCGDLNVAPEDRDVARPHEWRDTVLCHEDGRAAMKDLMSWGLVDTIRLHHNGPGPYSWWDYRMLAFPKGNGLRLDHILATRSMADRCTDAFVDRDERKGEKPSDHAPVIAVFS